MVRAFKQFLKANGVKELDQMKQGVRSSPSQKEFLLYVVQKMCIKLQAKAKSRLQPCVPLVMPELYVTNGHLCRKTVQSQPQRLL